MLTEGRKGGPSGRETCKSNDVSSGLTDCTFPHISTHKVLLTRMNDCNHFGH